jgi:short-subunit dehydrogenase
MKSNTNVLKILVTGASGAIGAATGEVLRARGSVVVPIQRAETDFSSYEEISELADKMLRDHTSFDWLVFAHGFIDSEVDFEKQSRVNIDATFAINTLSIIYFTQKILPVLQKGIVFVSSTAAISPNGNYAAYSASKAAVNGFAQALARNRPQQTFIAVCPGATNTPMRKKIATDAASAQAPSVVATAIADIVTGQSKYKSGDIVIVKNGVDMLHSSLD